MANFVRHEPCPNCGSTDNLAIYDDGSYHCFSDCGYTKPSQEYIEANAKVAKNAKAAKAKTKVNTERNIMEETVKSTKPVITEEKAAEIKASTSKNPKLIDCFLSIILFLFSFRKMVF